MSPAPKIDLLFFLLVNFFVEAKHKYRECTNHKCTVQLAFSENLCDLHPDQEVEHSLLALPRATL